MCSGCCGGDDEDIESRADKIQLARREEHEGPLVGGVAVGRERLEEGWRNDWGVPLGISKHSKVWTEHLPDLETSGRCPGLGKERKGQAYGQRRAGLRTLTYLVWAVFLPCPRTRREVPLSHTQHPQKSHFCPCSLAHHECRLPQPKVLFALRPPFTPKHPLTMTAHVGRGEATKRVSSR